MKIVLILTLLLTLTVEAKQNKVSKPAKMSKPAKTSKPSKTSKGAKEQMKVATSSGIGWFCKNPPISNSSECIQKAKEALLRSGCGLGNSECAIVTKGGLLHSNMNDWTCTGSIERCHQTAASFCAEGFNRVKLAEVDKISWNFNTNICVRHPEATEEERSRAGKSTH